MKSNLETRLRKLEETTYEPDTNWSLWLDLASADLRVISIGPDHDELQDRAGFCEKLPIIVYRLDEDHKTFIASAKDMLTTLSDELRPGALQSDMTARYCFALQRIQADKPSTQDLSISDIMRAGRERQRTLEAEPGGIERDARERIAKVREVMDKTGRLIIHRDTAGRIVAGIETAIRRRPNDPPMSDDV